MLYLLAILLPPVAVLFCGKPIQALLNLALTLCAWVPGVVHAILVVNDYKQQQRTEQLVEALRRK
jgi:uncharacterized membrane protein YqaE (UPF0057 family)